MGRPEITDDQREIAVEMLANAIRKDAHLRARTDELQEQDNPLRYVEGMRDLLRVLFVNGYEVAEACLEEAYVRALGTSVNVQNNGNGAPYQ